MLNRSMTAQPTVATRRWGIVTLATTVMAMAALAALDAGAAARQARPEKVVEATAPRQAGEPIMAIVSLKSQKVTFYDTEGWILRAPVSTGTTGRETPAGVFAVVEKDKVRADGRGHGHGVGFCQWGARGQGLAGKTAAEIVRHYYPGTELKTLDY